MLVLQTFCMKDILILIKQVKKYGEVVVGLLTDQAIASYVNIPQLSYKQREIVLKKYKIYQKVIPQKTLDYSDNLKLIKPDYVVHGDDWKKGIQKPIRLKVIKTLKKMGGKLMEPKYTENISLYNYQKKYHKLFLIARVLIKRLTYSKDIVILESLQLLLI